jgi:hypothetical protein
MSWSRLTFDLALRAASRPRLAVALARVAWRFRSRNWYAHFPFLPIPDATYVKWRMHTAYGDYDAVPSVDDVEQYALWATSEQ